MTRSDPEPGPAPSAHLTPRARGLARNSVLVAVSKASLGLLFIVHIVAARVLGPEAFGRFALALTVASLLVMLPGWGSNRYTLIMAARDPSRLNPLVADNLGLTTLLSGPYLLLVGAVAAGVGGVEVAVTALILGADLLARNVAMLMRSTFWVWDVYALYAVAGLVERLFILAAATTALVLMASPVGLALGFVAGRAAGAAFATALYLRQGGRLRLGFDRARLVELFRGGTPLALRGGLSSLSFRIDMVVLGLFRSATEVGWYGSVYRLMDGLLAVPTVVTGALGPPLSANYGVGRHDVIERLYGRGLKYLLISGLFVAAVCVVLAEPIVLLVYGAEFGAAAVALRLLAAAVVFLFARQMAMEVLDNVDRRAATVRVFAGSLGLNLLLNLAVVPTFGYRAAAVTTVITEGFVAAVMIGLARRAGYSGGVLAQAARPLLAATGAGFVMHYLSSHLAVALGAGAAAYLLGLTLLRVWDPKDLEVVRGIRLPVPGRRSGPDPRT